MKNGDKAAKIAAAIAIAVIIMLFGAAILRTEKYNSTERNLFLKGDALYNIPDYSGLTVELSKEPGGWSTEIDGASFDAYTLCPTITNPTQEELTDYRVRINVNSDVYFITGWCGTVEFHQCAASGKEKVQTIDLRDRPDNYIVDTFPTDDATLIPLYAGDWFVYIPSSTEGEAPLAAGASCTPGLMYYEASGAKNVFEFVPYEAPETSLEETDGITAILSARSSTWTKIFNFEGADNPEPDYQAYTYDLTIENGSDALLSDYTFTFAFNTEAYLASAWNGSLEINQNDVKQYIEDLRSFDASDLEIKTVSVDGEDFIVLNEQDSFIYYPNTAQTANEIPVNAGGSSVPGFIVYLKIGDSLSNPSIVLNYKLQKTVSSDIMFKLGIGASALFLLLLIIYLVTLAQRKRFEMIHEHDGEIIRESIETFTGFIDAKDPYTNGHSRRVAEYTGMIAENMGYKDEELERVYYIALLHDCGKMGIADNILTKPGKLTPEEFDVIKSHTTKGRDILSNFNSIKDVTEGAVYHHERYDGTGYPEGKKGTDIPEIARIICVADSFDAMNTDRCYRKKLPREKIISELEINKGRQFDPEIADVMLRLIEENKISI